VVVVGERSLDFRRCYFVMYSVGWNDGECLKQQRLQVQHYRKIIIADGRFIHVWRKRRAPAFGNHHMRPPVTSERESPVSGVLVTKICRDRGCRM